MKLLVVKDYEEMSEVAAKIFKEVISEKTNAVLGLATGSTPEGLYKKIIGMNRNKEIDFSNIKTVNLDEYVGLGGEDPQSYRYFMNEKLFNHVNINKANTFVPNGLAKNLDEEAKNYDKKVDELGGIDIQILGIGANGHIAFNEPDDFLIAETHVTGLTKTTIEANSRFFKSIEEVPTKALSMGLGQIMKARKIVLLVRGQDKAEAIKGLFKGNITTHNPATMLHMHKDVTVIIDEEMANAIK